MKSLFCTLILFLVFVVTSCAQQQEGKASYYADKFHGKSTASGEKYDIEKLTAAHRSLPFGTHVEVTNKKNQKSVIVTINDRGPFVKGRIIDLSRAAANKIDLIRDGVASVSIRILEENEPRH